MSKYKESFYLSLRPEEDRREAYWPFIYTKYGYPLFIDEKNIIQKITHKLVYSDNIKIRKQFNKQMKNW